MKKHKKWKQLFQLTIASLVLLAGVCWTTDSAAYAYPVDPSETFSEAVTDETTETHEHTIVTDKAIAPTCTKEGLTEGSHCSVCGEVLKAQETIPMLEHDYVKKVVKATTKKNGSVYYECSACKNVKDKKTIYYPEKITLSKTSYTYNGEVKKPGVKVVGSDGKTISKSYYTVSYDSGRKNAGSYNVTVKFKTYYTGSVSRTFKINKASQKITASDLTVTVGSSKSIGAKRTAGNGKLSYSSSSKKIATVSTKGKVTGKKAGKTSIKITAAETANYKKAVKKITVTVKPKGTSLTSVSSKKNGQLTVKWKKGSSISGYQLRYSKNSSMKNAKIVTISKSATSKTLSGLTKGAKYYVQIRTYTTSSDTKYYSSWSSKKSAVIANTSKPPHSGKVMATKTGSCYHTHPCGNGNYYYTTWDEVERRGLRPCKKCY
ncbi:MAG: fibronectin type III domain-containing protein [Lachnospiraceae bacterium]|nr:fibronectin type III domain-containing protein [Lachnospiraceae bacterium]